MLMQCCMYIERIEMYYRHIETNAKNKAAHDAGLKSDARARLDKIAVDKRKRRLQQG